MNGLQIREHQFRWCHIVAGRAQEHDGEVLPLHHLESVFRLMVQCSIQQNDTICSPIGSLLIQTPGKMMEEGFEHLTNGINLREAHPTVAQSIHRKEKRQGWHNLLLGEAIAMASCMPLPPPVITVIDNGFIYVYEHFSSQHEWQVGQRPLLPQQSILGAVVLHAQWSDFRVVEGGLLLHHLPQFP